MRSQLSSLVFVFILLMPIIAGAQTIDSIRIAPAVPGPMDSIQVHIFYYTVASGTHLRRSEIATDPANRRLDVRMYFRYSIWNSWPVTHYCDTFAFPPLGNGPLEVCCSVYDDTNSVPGPYNNWMLNDSIVFFYDTCEHFSILGTDEQSFPQDELRVWPNPMTGDELWVHFPHRSVGEELSYRLTDLRGRLVQQGTFLNGQAIDLCYATPSVQVLVLWAGGFGQGTRTIIRPGD